MLDDGIPRPEVASWMAYGSRIAIADAATVFARSQASTTDELRRLSVDERGVREVAMRAGLVGQTDELASSGGLLLSTTGEVVDAAALRTIGRYPVAGPNVSDPSSHRTYVVGPATSEVRAVYAFDRGTFEVAAVLLQLRLETGEQGKGVRGRPGETSQDAFVMETPNLPGALLHRRFGQT